MNPLEENKIQNPDIDTDSVNYCLEVKEVIEDLLRRLNIVFEEIEVFKGLSESGPKFIIKSDESGILIGYRGDHLRALSHIARRIVIKKKGLAKFTLDINNYQEENVKKIRNLALSLAKTAQETGEAQEMEPMSSYERMLVHSLFPPDSPIATESIGEKGRRRVVIKPRKN